MQIAQINNWIRDRLKDNCFPACPWFTLYRCNQILLPLCPESVVYTCSLSFLILLIFYQLTIYQIISIFLDSGDINRITCSIPSPYMNLMPETLILHTKVFLSLLHPDLSLSHHFLCLFNQNLNHLLRDSASSVICTGIDIHQMRPIACRVRECRHNPYIG